MKPVDEDELRVIIALVRKLGGQVELSMKDLMDAEDFELERSDPMSFSGGMLLRTRIAPVTVQGETVPGTKELPK